MWEQTHLRGHGANLIYQLGCGIHRPLGARLRQLEQAHDTALVLVSTRQEVNRRRNACRTRACGERALNLLLQC